MYTKWTDDEDQVLEFNYKIYSYKELAKILGKTESAVSQRVYKLKKDKRIKSKGLKTAETKIQESNTGGVNAEEMIKNEKQKIIAEEVKILAREIAEIDSEIEEMQKERHVLYLKLQNLLN